MPKIFAGFSSSVGIAAAVASIFALFFSAAHFVKSAELAPTVRYPGTPGSNSYLGDEACAECHREKSSAYVHTAHANTSHRASPDSVHGPFGAGRNQLRTGNPNLYFQMEARDGHFFQTAIARTSPSEAMTREEEIAIVIGSGRKGQTYLYWDQDRLYQLPVSYWTDIHAWVNSPGYADGYANFERPIDPRCLECHASRFESRAPPVNRFERASLVLGLTCEKCHGPGEAHVRQHRLALASARVSDERIVNPARLPRERQMDACGLCHAGIGNSTTPPLSFQAGDELDRHLTFPAVDPQAPIDVHASQIQLLERSRCYRSSANLTCTTCHDVHQTQRDVTTFATRCLACHRVEACKKLAHADPALASRCVDCHMPLQVTSQIVSIANGQSLQPRVRNHRIAIYPESAGK